MVPKAQMRSPPAWRDPLAHPTPPTQRFGRPAKHLVHLGALFAEDHLASEEKVSNPQVDTAAERTEVRGQRLEPLPRNVGRHRERD